MQILATSTSKSALAPSVFNDFDFQIVLARRRGANFVTSWATDPPRPPVLRTWLFESAKPQNYGKRQHFAHFLPAKSSCLTSLLYHICAITSLDWQIFSSNFQYSRKLDRVFCFFHANQDDQGEPARPNLTQLDLGRNKLTELDNISEWTPLLQKAFLYENRLVRPPRSGSLVGLVSSGVGWKTKASLPELHLPLLTDLWVRWGSIQEQELRWGSCIRSEPTEEPCWNMVDPQYITDNLRKIMLIFKEQAKFVATLLFSF